MGHADLLERFAFSETALEMYLRAAPPNRMTPDLEKALGVMRDLHDALIASGGSEGQGPTVSIYDEIRAERERAHALHGDTSMEAFAWDDLTRYTVLVEEVGEVACAFNDRRHGIVSDPQAQAQVRKELIQVAAMAAAWADALGHP